MQQTTTISGPKGRLLRYEGHRASKQGRIPCLPLSGKVYKRRRLLRPVSMCLQSATRFRYSMLYSVASRSLSLHTSLTSFEERLDRSPRGGRSCSQRSAALYVRDPETLARRCNWSSPSRSIIPFRLRSRSEAPAPNFHPRYAILSEWDICKAGQSNAGLMTPHLPDDVFWRWVVYENTIACDSARCDLSPDPEVRYLLQPERISSMGVLGRAEC